MGSQCPESSGAVLEGDVLGLGMLVEQLGDLVDGQRDRHDCMVRGKVCGWLGEEHEGRKEGKRRGLSREPAK